MTNRQAASNQRVTAHADLAKVASSDSDVFDLSKMTKQEIAAELVRRHLALNSEVNGDVVNSQADEGQRPDPFFSPSIALTTQASRPVERVAHQGPGTLGMPDATVGQKSNAVDDPLDRHAAQLQPLRADMVKPHVTTSTVTIDDLRVPKDHIAPVSPLTARLRPARSKRATGMAATFLVGMLSGVLLLGLGLVGAGAFYFKPQLLLRWSQFQTLSRSSTTSAMTPAPVVAAGSSAVVPGAPADFAASATIPAPAESVARRQGRQLSAAQPDSQAPASPALQEVPEPSIQPKSAIPPAGALQPPSSPTRSPTMPLKAIQVGAVPAKSVPVKPAAVRPSKAWLTPQPFVPNAAEGVVPSMDKAGRAWLTPQPFDPDLVPRQ